MLIGNDTPFAAIGFGDLHRDGMEMAVVSVRARYDIAAEGRLRLADAQQIVLNDVYEGDPQRTPLLQVGDLIPFKPCADVTLLGSACAPTDRAAETWEVGLSVGSYATRLRVHGPRSWEPAFKMLKPTWKLGRATPTRSVPIDYRLAAGGRYLGDPEGRLDDRNPIGPGLLCREASQVGYPLRAPQIDSASTPIEDPFVGAEPQGFGPVPPFWAWRERHLGTRDEEWQHKRRPQMPKDFSYRFFQSAHPNLVIPSLRGDEQVRLNGLVPGGGALAFTLPGIVPIAHHVWFDGRTARARLTLDGMHLDLRGTGPWRVDLTWRGWIIRDPDYRGARLDVWSLVESSPLASSAENGLTTMEPPA